MSEEQKSPEPGAPEKREWTEADELRARTLPEDYVPGGGAPPSGPDEDRYFRTLWRSLLLLFAINVMASLGAALLWQDWTTPLWMCFWVGLAELGFSSLAASEYRAVGRKPEAAAIVTAACILFAVSCGTCTLTSSWWFMV